MCGQRGFSKSASQAHGGEPGSPCLLSLPLADLWLLSSPSTLKATVDDINPALPLRTLNYGNYGIYLIMGHAGFIP